MTFIDCVEGDWNKKLFSFSLDFEISTKEKKEKEFYQGHCLHNIARFERNLSRVGVEEASLSISSTRHYVLFIGFLAIGQ